MTRKKVLFVCLGNICRSPTAEAVFNAMIIKKGLEDCLFAESAGTAGYHVGEEPDPRTREHGQKRGYRFTTLARQLDPSRDFEDFDLILCMDQSNLRNVQKADKEQKHGEKVKLLLEFASSRDSLEVPDPYYSGPEVFEQVLDLCEEACLGLITTLVPQRV